MPDGSMEFCASNKDLRRIVSVNPGLETRVYTRETFLDVCSLGCNDSETPVSS
jgi:hypothetical protein